MKFPGLSALRGARSWLTRKSVDPAAEYGRKIKFALGSPLTFADFELTYMGARRISSDVFPEGFRYHDFRVAATNEQQTISWSSGTGDIAPVSFVCGGKTYELELAISDGLGKLAADELVVRKK